MMKKDIRHRLSMLICGVLLYVVLSAEAIAHTPVEPPVGAYPAYWTNWSVYPYSYYCR